MREIFLTRKYNETECSKQIRIQESNLFSSISCCLLFFKARFQSNYNIIIIAHSRKTKYKIEKYAIDFLTHVLRFVAYTRFIVGFLAFSLLFQVFFKPFHIPRSNF